MKTSNGYQEEEKTSFWQIVRVSSSRRPRIFCRASSPARDLIWLIVYLMADPLIRTMRTHLGGSFCCLSLFQPYSISAGVKSSLAVNRTDGLFSSACLQVI